MDERRHATEDRRVDTGRGSLFVRCWAAPQRAHAHDGVPPPIVLFHDSLGCVRLWRTFPQALAECTGRQVIAYDRLGFGQSDPRTDTLDASFVRDEARRFFPMLRGQLGFDRFVALGHSVGGGMAVHCAAAYPSACEALVTESAQAFVEDRTRAGVADAREQFKQRDAFERLRAYHGDKARWVLDAWIDTWLSSGFAGWSLEDALPQVTCPTLAIHGSDDEYGSNLHPETIARLVAGPARIEIVPGARHVPHRERERWVAELVATFLREVRCGGSEQGGSE